MMGKWIHYVPRFETRDMYDDRGMPWYGHIFFGYDLVRNIKPKRIVELGTEKGTSLYSFLQAIKDGELDTEVFAVDSWEGDKHADYTAENGEEYLQLVTRLLRSYYTKQSVRLLKMYFKEALTEVEDGSVDILHIDGLHTYEAVMEDYSTWKSKLSKDSVVLFHDTKVAEFGVWKALKEIVKEYDDGISFEFVHSYGLGVVAKGAAAKALEPLLDDFEYYRELYLSEDRLAKEEKARVDSVERELSSLNNRIASMQHEIDTMNNDLASTRDQNEALKSQLSLANKKAEENQIILNRYYSLRSRKYLLPYKLFLRLLGKQI